MKILLLIYTNQTCTLTWARTRHQRMSDVELNVVTSAKEARWRGIPAGGRDHRLCVCVCTYSVSSLCFCPPPTRYYTPDIDYWSAFSPLKEPDVGSSLDSLWSWSASSGWGADDRYSRAVCLLIRASDIDRHYRAESFGFTSHCFFSVQTSVHFQFVTSLLFRSFIDFETFFHSYSSMHEVFIYRSWPQLLITWRFTRRWGCNNSFNLKLCCLEMFLSNGIFDIFKHQLWVLITFLNMDVTFRTKPSLESLCFLLGNVWSIDRSAGNI